MGAVSGHVHQTLSAPRARNHGDDGSSLAETVPISALMEQVSMPAVSVPLGTPVRRRLVRRLVGLAVLVLAAVGLYLHHGVGNYRVTSGSMEPTLQIGQRLTATSSIAPAIGNIVVFHPPTGAHAANPVCGVTGEGSGSSQPCGAPVPQEASGIFVKRVVAGPGDLISIVDGHVVRNGIREADPYIEPCTPNEECSFPTAVTVPPNEYYVLGDNRGVSDDSRFWGPVPSSWIIGTVVRCSWLDTVCHPMH